MKHFFVTAIIACLPASALAEPPALVVGVPYYQTEVGGARDNPFFAPFSFEAPAAKTYTITVSSMITAIADGVHIAQVNMVQLKDMAGHDYGSFTQSTVGDGLTVWTFKGVLEPGVKYFIGVRGTSHSKTSNGWVQRGAIRALVEVN